MRFILAIVAAVVFGAAQASAGVLDEVKARGVLNCGVSPGVVGFSLPDEKGDWYGLDVDFCRAVAAAVFGDASKVKFFKTTAKERFTVLQSGEIDVLARNSTWSLSRDTALGLSFTAVNFYDGQGFMVRKSLNAKSAKELNGASICVQQGTTTELNLADYFRTNGLKFEPVVFEMSEDVSKAYEAGRCDALTNDASAFYNNRVKFAKPEEHVVLPDIISKEPLGPVVRKGDPQWLDIIKWVHFAQVTAEELGVTKANAEEKKKSDNPEIKRLLGIEGEYGKGLGLSNDWAFRIVSLVGNYGEVFDRNVGMGSKMQLARGLNNLWSKGGLQYAPPIR